MNTTPLPLSRELSPRPDSDLGVWWLGAADAPAWLTGLVGRVEVARQASDLPLDGVEVVLLEPTAEWVGGAAGVLHAIRQRCAHAEMVIVAHDVAPIAEARLLRGGAALVLDDRVEPDLAAARFEQVRCLVRARRALRRAGDGHHEATSDEQYGKRLMALSFASRLLTTVHDEQEVFRRLVDIVARELNSRRVSLMHVNRADGVLEIRAAVGISEEVIRNARPRVGEGIAGTCVVLGKPLFIDDHRRLREAGDGDLREYMPDDKDFRHMPMSLTVPIRVKGNVVGVVNVTDRKDDQRYTQQDIAFIQALMGQAGYLLENHALMRHLQELRAFSEQVINALEDPLAVLDDDLRIVSCNRRFARDFGAAPGDHVWDVLPLPDESRQVIARAVLGEPDQPRGLQEWFLGDREFEASLTQFADGDRPRLLVFMREMTARRQMERRLVGAEKMASLGVLAAGVAHEINNPISFIKANARHAGQYIEELGEVLEAWHTAAAAIGPHPAITAARKAEKELEAETLFEHMREMMGESLAGVARVERIVQSLRSFAHPDTEKAVSAELHNLLENAITLTAGQWKYKLDLVREFEAVPSIWCLPNQLEQVFMNLISNAAQAASEWGRMVIGVAPADNGVCIKFQDNCGGIPAAIVDRIYEPFFTTKDIGQGTGLGLSICYNTVQNHGGRIEVHSTEGVGTCFEIWLPAGDEQRPIVAKQLSRYRI